MRGTLPIKSQATELALPQPILPRPCFCLLYYGESKLATRRHKCEMSVSKWAFRGWTLLILSNMLIYVFSKTSTKCLNCVSAIGFSIFFVFFSLFTFKSIFENVPKISCRFDSYPKKIQNRYLILGLGRNCRLPQLGLGLAYEAFSRVLGSSTKVLNFIYLFIFNSIT